MNHEVAATSTMLLIYASPAVTESATYVVAAMREFAERGTIADDEAELLRLEEPLTDAHTEDLRVIRGDLGLPTA